MINKITIAPNQISFNSSNNLKNKHLKYSDNEAPKLLKIGTFLTSLACGAGVTYAISKKQSALLNKKVNIFNVKYSEKDMLNVAFAALLGGMFTGIIFDDKKYVKAKLQEALHQAVANIACPLLLVLGLNNGYEKISNHIKLPQVKETSKLNKNINIGIKLLPNLALTVFGLVSGVLIGTKISNFISKKMNDRFEERKVKLLDFIYHPDDVGAALVLADKQGSLQKIIGRIIPPVFALHGFEAGSKRAHFDLD